MRRCGRCVASKPGLANATLAAASCTLIIAIPLDLHGAVVCSLVSTALQECQNLQPSLWCCWPAWPIPLLTMGEK